MLTTYIYTLRSLVRQKALVLWALAFPIILSTLFFAMLGNIGQSYALDPFPLGVVEDANYPRAYGLDETLTSLTDPSADERIFTLTTCDDTDQAEQLVADGSIDGYLTVDQMGTPELHFARRAQGNDNAAVAKMVIDNYVQTFSEVVTVALSDPQALASEDSARSMLAAFSTDAAGTEKLQLTASDPDPSVRYYYSLMGMAAGMAAMIAAVAVSRTQATASPLGARRTLAGIPRWRVLAATLLASWTFSFVCLVAAFAYMRFALGVDFGGREGLCICTLALCSLMAPAVGSVAGSFARGGDGTGILVGLTCLLSLFTGLYGEASQALADAVSRNLPWLAAANPLWQISNSFYALLYYDSLGPWLTRCATMVAMAAGFFLVASLRMRRQQHEHL